MRDAIAGDLMTCMTNMGFPLDEIPTIAQLERSLNDSNREAFLDVVQKFARDRDFLQPDQWDKIAFMGRQIASDNPLFTEESAADDDLADCA